VNAWCLAPDGSREIMGIRHLEYSLIGLQFHPESFLTGVGPKLLERFLHIRCSTDGN
jgi:anthranilate/para-aminobenzoate synthase component II